VKECFAWGHLQPLGGGIKVALPLQAVLPAWTVDVNSAWPQARVCVLHAIQDCCSLDGIAIIASTTQRYRHRHCMPRFETA